MHDVSQNPENRERIDRLRPSVISVLHPEQIFGRPYRFANAAELLRQTRLLPALQVMAVLNAVSVDLDRLASQNQKALTPHLGPLFAFLFARHRLDRVVKAATDLIVPAIADGLGYFTPLSPWACSALTDACLRFCSLGNFGADVWPPSQADYFGRLILSFQRQMTPERDKRTGLDLDRLTEIQFSEFVRNQLHANPHRYSGKDMTRLYALFEIPDVGAVLHARAHVTSQEWFKNIVGISALEYRVLLVALAATTMNFNLEQPSVRYLLFNVGQLIANMTPEAKQAFMRLNALAVIDLRALRVEPQPHTWAEALFKGNHLLRRQLFETAPGTYLVLDRNEYLNRFFHRLLHVLHAAAECQAGTRSPSRVRSDCGYLFEGYVQWWLKQLFGPSTTYFFNHRLPDGKETDAIVMVGSTALVLELNHHWLSLAEAYEATPARLAAVVSEDLGKALHTSRVLAQDGIHKDGKLLIVDRIIPIAVLPEGLPIGDLTYATFKNQLQQILPELDGVLPKIGPCQVLSQDHLEYFDRVWKLPEQGSQLVAYLIRRASTGYLRFGPLPLDVPQIPATHSGHTWGPLTDKARSAFGESAKAFFSAESMDP